MSAIQPPAFEHDFNFLHLFLLELLPKNGFRPKLDKKNEKTKNNLFPRIEQRIECALTGLIKLTHGPESLHAFAIELLNR